MKYSLRCWMSTPGSLFDDVETANSPEEAIGKAKQLLGIFDNIIDDEVQQKIMDMAKGEKIVIKKSYIKTTLHIKRLR